MTYKFDFSALEPYWETFLRGCWQTICLAVVAVVLRLIIGIAAMLAKRSAVKAVRVGATSYIEIVRNTPFLVQVMFIFFGLPTIGISLSPWTAAILALSLNCGAFAAEIIRGGVEAISRGQIEAGTALGLKPFQIFRFIVLKPALRIIFPALSGQFILALLTTSIVSSISAEELASISQSIDAATFRSFEVYVVATLLYFGLSLIFSTAFKAINRIYFSYPVR